MGNLRASGARARTAVGTGWQIVGRLACGARSHIKEILGPANGSQTDAYLNAGRVALQASMQRFDALRG
jgi:hypothetical protein